MATWLVNSFSLNMVAPEAVNRLRVESITLEQARAVARSSRSAVGHADTAALLSSQLGIDVACDRQTIVLGPGDRAIVAQYTGPRLGEGSTRLPDGAAIRWYLATLPRPREGNTVEELRGLPQIVLASGQTHPNVLAARELGATGFAVLHTGQERPERLTRALQAVGRATALTSPVEIDAHVQSSIAEAVRTALPSLRAASERWVFNATAGTKQMVLGVLRALRGWDAFAGYFYLDGQTLYAPNDGSDGRAPLNVRLGVADLLQAHGIAPANSASSLPAGTLVFRAKADPDPASRAVARAIGEDCSNAENRIGKLRGGGPISNAAARGLVGHYLPHGTPWPRTQSPSEFVNGFWLEHRVFDMIERNRQDLGVDDLAWGVDLRRVGPVGTDTITDLDVCFTGSNRFCFVSCKTDAAEGLRDEVYEVAARRQQVGGLQGRGVLVHWHPAHNKHVARALQAAASFGVTVLDRSHVEDEKLFCGAIKKLLAW